MNKTPGDTSMCRERVCFFAGSRSCHLDGWVAGCLKNDVELILCTGENAQSGATRGKKREEISLINFILCLCSAASRCRRTNVPRATVNSDWSCFSLSSDLDSWDGLYEFDDMYGCIYLYVPVCEGEATRLAELALIFIPTVFIALSAKYRSQLHYK